MLNPIDLHNTLNDAKKYALSNTNILNILNNICIIKNKKLNTYEKNVKKKKYLDQNKDFFSPKYQNTLFWCWYIFNNGYQDYEFSIDNGFRIQENEKIKLIEKMRQHKKLLSSYRLKLLDLENNILFEKLSMTSLYALSIIENVNLFIINNKTYFKNKINDDDDYCIVFKNQDDTFSIWNNSKKFPMYFYEESLFQVTNLNKPLKGVSSYKVAELVDMCEKLKHDIYNENGKRKTKKELYMMLYKDIV
tara:strand:+ start:2822 stop:3565 length:744 start_codon:yes stop_codon:yes gene_type:complete